MHQMLFTHCQYVNLLDCGSSSKNDSAMNSDDLAYVLNNINTYIKMANVLNRINTYEDGYSDICEEQAEYNPDGNAKIIALNDGIASGVVTSNEFSRLSVFDSMLVGLLYYYYLCAVYVYPCANTIRWFLCFDVCLVSHDITKK